jgi:hypothetical protein
MSDLPHTEAGQVLAIEQLTDEESAVFVAVKQDPTQLVRIRWRPQVPAGMAPQPVMQFKDPKTGKQLFYMTMLQPIVIDPAIFGDDAIVSPVSPERTALRALKCFQKGLRGIEVVFLYRRSALPLKLQKQVGEERPALQLPSGPVAGDEQRLSVRTMTKGPGGLFLRSSCIRQLQEAIETGDVTASTLSMALHFLQEDQGGR